MTGVQTCALPIYYIKNIIYEEFAKNNKEEEKEDFFIHNLDVFKMQQIWHEAMEYNYYKKASNIICTSNETLKDDIKYQAIFCIDAREESLRRHLENLSTNIETFGTPGFFNIDSFLLDAYATQKEKICPLGVEPEHIILRKNKFKNNKYLALINYATKYGSNNIFVLNSILVNYK